MRLKFLFLEDRLLQALFKLKGPVTLKQISDLICITPAAALSITHRNQKAYPTYLSLQEEAKIEDCCLNSVYSQIFSEGGFTRINEQEFLYYYEKELRREKRVALINLYKEKNKRENGFIGIGTLVGLGIIIATYQHRKNIPLF